jgi:hypothetical protein
MVHSAGCGTALALLAQPAGQRDPALSKASREAVMAAIITDEESAQSDTGTVDPVTTAVALRAVLPRTSALTKRERALLEEWLERLAEA